MSNINLTATASWREPRDGAGRRKERAIQHIVFDDNTALELVMQLVQDREINLLNADFATANVSCVNEQLVFQMATACGREMFQISAAPRSLMLIVAQIRLICDFKASICGKKK